MKPPSLTSRSPHHPQAGVALVEFALVVPILFIVLFGILDFGKAFNYWNDETHLASEASRFAAVNRNPATDGSTLQSYIASQADSSELRSGGTSAVSSPLQVCVDFPAGTSNVGDPVRVTVKTTYHFIPILRGAFSGVVDPQKTLTATSTMRLEAPPTNYSANPC